MRAEYTPEQPGAGGGDTGGGSAAGCLDPMAAAGFLDTVEGDVGALPWTDWTHRTHKNQRTENDKQRSWVVSLSTDCTPVGTRQLSPQK
jgi:hypothetical protein